MPVRIPPDCDLRPDSQYLTWLLLTLSHRRLGRPRRCFLIFPFPKLKEEHRDEQESIGSR